MVRCLSRRKTLRSMKGSRLRAQLPLISLAAFLPISMGLEASQVPQDLDVLSDEALYQASGYFVLPS